MNPHSVDSRRKASIRGRFAVPQDCGQSLIETALVLPLLLLMAFNAKVYRVLIASSSDVPNERLDYASAFDADKNR